MTYFGSGHNLLRRGDFGQWTSAAREDGDSDAVGRGVGRGGVVFNGCAMWANRARVWGLRPTHRGT